MPTDEVCRRGGHATTRAGVTRQGPDRTRPQSQLLMCSPAPWIGLKRSGQAQKCHPEQADESGSQAYRGTQARRDVSTRLGADERSSGRPWGIVERHEFVGVWGAAGPSEWVDWSRRGAARPSEMSSQASLRSSPEQAQVRPDPCRAHACRSRTAQSEEIRVAGALEGVKRPAFRPRPRLPRSLGASGARPRRDSPPESRGRHRWVRGPPAG